MVRDAMPLLSRRLFVRAGAVAAGSLALGGLAGCAGGGDAGAEDPGAAQRKTAAEGASQQESPASAGAAQEEVAPVADRAESPQGQVAVAFFSCTGNTRAVAEKIADAAGGTLVEIVPADPYDAADLDYNAGCRANDEQQNPATRPALADPAPDLAAYDTVYLGYPIWWGTAPRVVLTFAEGAALSGKRVVPFCTSGSSAIGSSLPELEQSAPDALWGEGRRFDRGVSTADVAAWVAAS